MPRGHWTEFPQPWSSWFSKKNQKSGFFFFYMKLPYFSILRSLFSLLHLHLPLAWAQPLTCRPQGSVSWAVKWAEGSQPPGGVI